MTVSAPSQVFADRIGRIEVSATMAVAAEAAKLRAQGANLVDFGAGEPHFPTPRHIKDAAIAAIEANFTRYTVVPGIPDVRKAIVERHACRLRLRLRASTRPSSPPAASWRSSTPSRSSSITATR